MKESFWTKKKTEEFIALCKQGDSLAIIAEKLGTTRGACASKARRLKVAEKKLQPIKLPKIIKLPSPCTIFQLENESCRWPLWNDHNDRRLYCGKPEANLLNDIPYCHEHTKDSKGKST